MYSRKKKLALNSITSVAHQLVAIICGFITPRLILSAFGSDINGLVSSITNFLGIISLIELGVGTVVNSSLFEPLARHDVAWISKIYVSADRFFKRIALILLLYTLFLLFTYPYIIDVKYDFWFTASLIITICIDFFSRYYFGITNSILLSSDQKAYINNIIIIVTLIINTFSVALLIYMGMSIQVVKMATSVIFLARPVFLSWYVARHYEINRKIDFAEEPIKQKWNGIAQHFAAFSLNTMPMVFLTCFSTLSNVSVYATYNLVTTGIINFFSSATSGIFSYFGDMWAREEKETLREDFYFFEWLIHNAAVLIFGCTGMLIVSFVQVYTRGITDANYIQPVFSALLVSAFAVRILRLPYNYLILATGHYKQTQHNYIIATGLIIAVSLFAVPEFGLKGVAAGMLAAMIYQTVWMAWYDYKTFLQDPMNHFYKIIIFDIIFVLIGISVSSSIQMSSVSYFSWAVQGLSIFSVWTVVMMVLNLLFYRTECKKISVFILRKVRNK